MGGETAAAVTPGPRIGAHPMGGGLRSVMFKIILELMGERVNAEHPAKVSITALAALKPGDLDGIIHRGAPKFGDPKAGTPWVWNFMLKERVPENFAIALQTMRDHPMAATGIKIAPQHSIDGNITKWLAAWNAANRQATS